MISKTAQTALLAILMIASTRTVHAEEWSYTGNILIHSIEAHISIDEHANVLVQYDLINEGDTEESVDFAFSPFPVQLRIGDEEVQNPLIFAPGEEKKVSIGYVAEVEGEATKVFSFDPTLTFNGKVHPKRVRSVLAEIILPAGIKGIIGASHELQREEAVVTGRVSYRWEEEDIYPTTLTIRWSTLDVNLSVEKKVSPLRITGPNQILNIEILVWNKGDNEVSGIVISDDYVPSEFEAVGPLEEFSLQEPHQSDPRLFWAKQIEKLAPGETTTFTYAVRYMGDVSQIVDLEIKPCIVFVDGNLVGVSNEVLLTKMVGANPAGEEVPIEPSAPAKPSDALFIAVIAAGAVIGVGLIVAGMILSRRKK